MVLLLLAATASLGRAQGRSETQVLDDNPLQRHEALAPAAVLELQLSRSPLAGADVDRQIAMFRRDMKADIFVAVSSSFWESDTGGFISAVRYREAGWSFGLQLAVSRVIPAEGAEEMDTASYVNLGPTVGYHRAFLGRILLEAELQPNVLQLGGSGSREGSYRGSPAFASVDLPLLLGVFVRAGGGVYLGDGIAPVWSATVGWRLIGAGSFYDY